MFLAPYTLPVPFWIYLYGCAAMLVLSFALLAYLATSSVSTREPEVGASMFARTGTERCGNGPLPALRAGARGRAGD